MDPRLQRFNATLDELYRLSAIQSLLGWDQLVMMPPSGAENRAGQLALIERYSHEKFTAPDFVRLVDDLAADREKLSPDDWVNVRETKRSVERKIKIPSSLVEERVRAQAASYMAWTQAKPRGDFAGVVSHLKTLVRICRDEAQFIGGRGNPYDALLDLYEPDGKADVLRPMLLRLAERLSALVGKIGTRLSEGPRPGRFPLSSQDRLNREIMKALGLTPDMSRLDTSPHPFMSHGGVGDIRITTRYFEENFLASLMCVPHESGHALYDALLPRAHAGRPRGTSISISIHESQSRFWENIVGKSRSFAEYLYPRARIEFGDDFPYENGEVMWRCINRVAPSLNRVEADEVTYSLHIVIRFLLEDDLMNRRVEVEDLPDAWNALYRRYLGIEPESPREGVTQDMHWFEGLVGYFPSYLLGNLYSAAFTAAMERTTGPLDTLVRNGDFGPIVTWLQREIYDHGMTYTGAELVRAITGADLSEKPFLEYLEKKFLGEV